MSLEGAEVVLVKEEPEFEEDREHEAEDPVNEAAAQAGHIEYAAKKEREWEIVLEVVKSEHELKEELGASGVDHTGKDELVVGPVEIHRPKVVLEHPASLSTAEKSAVAGSACSVMLEHMRVDLQQRTCSIGPHTYKFRLGWFQILAPQDNDMPGRTQQEYRKKNLKSKSPVGDKVSETKVEPTRFDHAALLNIMRINFGQQCEKLYKCPHCSYASTTKSALKSHETTHAGEKPYKRAHCSYSSTRKTTLRDHIRIQTDQKPYKCAYCSYSSTYPSGLKNHEKTHTGEKPYKCPHCSYASARKANLKYHIITHTGEKPYKCAHCSYSSAQKTTLRDHIRIHTGEKPYKCAYCSYSSAHRIPLKSHETLHTGVKPYKCEHCSFSSAYKESLKIHIRTHTGEKPYKCTHCSYSSAASCTLIHHKLTQHTLV